MLLRATYGAVPIVAGLDKFTNFLTNWEGYLNPNLPEFIGISPRLMMMGSGTIEILVGILMFTRYARVVVYIVTVWLLAISANLISIGAYDIAVRDIVMTIGAAALALLFAYKRETAMR